MTLLLLGYGAFGGVPDNPSARLARALDGAQLGPLRVVGLEMPVSYARAERLTAAAIRRVRPAHVLAIGVAKDRSEPLVERVGRNVGNAGLADVDGVALAELGPGPATLSDPRAEALASALQVGLSPDAGTYLCNAWLYRALRAGRPGSFLHVPAAGMAVGTLAKGLARFGAALQVGTAG